MVRGVATISDEGTAMTYRPVCPAVTQDIALHCLDEIGRPMAFMASFDYDASDPYAVWLTFHVPAGDVEWTVARSLLVEGLTGPVGEGDVRMCPAQDEDGHAMVRMDFHSPEGRLVTQARADHLQHFLDHTRDAVPAGAEAALVDLDRLVESLLSS